MRVYKLLRLAGMQLKHSNSASVYKQYTRIFIMPRLAQYGVSVADVELAGRPTYIRPTCCVCMLTLFGRHFYGRKGTKRVHSRRLITDQRKNMEK